MPTSTQPIFQLPTDFMNVAFGYCLQFFQDYKLPLLVIFGVSLGLLILDGLIGGVKPPEK